MLSYLGGLKQAERADDDEVLAFIEMHRLMGRGVGLIDVHLLASAALSHVAIVSRDKRLQGVANTLGLGAAVT